MLKEDLYKKPIAGMAHLPKVYIKKETMGFLLTFSIYRKNSRKLNSKSLSFLIFRNTDLTFMFFLRFLIGFETLTESLSIGFFGFL